MNINTLKKAALFIDYENANLIETYQNLLKKLISLGYNPVIRKIISSKIPKIENFETIIKENEFEFILTNKVLKKGKDAKKKNLNNADFRVYIEVLNVLYTQNIDTFVLYSSDDDYYELICAIKRQGKEVIGVGQKIITSQKYIPLFHNFIYSDDLLPEIEIKEPESEIRKEEKIKIIPKKKNEIVKKDNVNNKPKATNVKDENFYKNLKEMILKILKQAKDNKHAEEIRTSVIIEIIKKQYPNFKDYKIPLNDFKKCGFTIKYKDNKRSQSYINLNVIN